jgi:hypothetical protein
LFQGEVKQRPTLPKGKEGRQGAAKVKTSQVTMASEAKADKPVVYERY